MWVVDPPLRGDGEAAGGYAPRCRCAPGSGCRSSRCASPRRPRPSCCPGRTSASCATMREVSTRRGPDRRVLALVGPRLARRVGCSTARWHRVDLAVLAARAASSIAHRCRWRWPPPCGTGHAQSPAVPLLRRPSPASVDRLRSRAGARSGARACDGLARVVPHHRWGARGADPPEWPSTVVGRRQASSSWPWWAWQFRRGRGGHAARTADRPGAPSTVSAVTRPVPRSGRRYRRDPHQARGARLAG